MEGKMEIRIFRRELCINDPDPTFTTPRKARESDLWLKECDGERCRFEFGGENGKSIEHGFFVNRNWTEPLDQEVK